jgi:hypothetical protein
MICKTKTKKVKWEIWEEINKNGNEPMPFFVWLKQSMNPLSKSHHNVTDNPQFLHPCSVLQKLGEVSFLD